MTESKKTIQAFSPLNNGIDQDSTARALNKADKYNNSDPHQGLRLLLIDDDPTFRLIMSRMAEIEHINLEIFESIFEIGRVRTSEKYHAAIIDLNLEKSSGIEAARAVTEIFGPIPIVIISESRNLALHPTWPREIITTLPKSVGYSAIISRGRTLAGNSIAEADGAQIESYINRLKLSA